MPGSIMIRSRSTPACDREPDPFFQVGEDLADHVGIDRVLLHVSRRALDMHDDQGRAGFSDYFAHVRREPETADVVHDGGAGIERPFRNGRFVRIHGDRYGQLRRKTFDERE